MMHLGMETATIDQPATVDALVADEPALLLEAMAGVDRSIASLLAIRARMIDRSRGLIEATEAARPTSRGPARTANWRGSCWCPNWRLCFASR